MRASPWLLLLLVCSLLAGCTTSRPETNAALKLRGDDDSSAAGSAPAVAARITTDRNLAEEFLRAGVLDQRGPGVWVVDGTPVLVDDTTEIIGDPVEGAWVTVEGRRGPDGVQRARIIRAGAVLELSGRLDSIAGELWVVEGVSVRVAPELLAGPAPQPGAYVRIIARRDGPDATTLVALRVTLAQELIVVGQVGAIESTLIIVDDRMLSLTPESLLAGGLAVGSFVRVTVRVGPDGGLSVITLSVLPTTVVVDGPLELIDDDVIVVSGRRLRLSPQVILRITLVIGQPVRLILSDDGTLVIAIITVRVIVIAPPPVPTVVVVPVPAPQPPPPAPAPAPRPSNNDDDDDDD